MAGIYVPVDVAQRVHTAARNRCGYCLSPQHLVMARLEIEHIIPRAKGGIRDETNLWLSCPICNRYKADLTEARDPESGQFIPLFNPRRHERREAVSAAIIRNNSQKNLFKPHMTGASRG